MLIVHLNTGIDENLEGNGNAYPIDFGKSYLIFLFSQIFNPIFTTSDGRYQLILDRVTDQIELKV